MTFEQAAVSSVAALTALQGFATKENSVPARSLDHGASGASETFAVQIAKSFGRGGDRVCSTRNLDLSIDRRRPRIDYTKGIHQNRSTTT